MPIHDWKKADVGLLHHFHQSRTVLLAEGLSAGVLPSGFFALVEQKAMGVEPDVLTPAARPRPRGGVEPAGGIVVAERPPAFGDPLPAMPVFLDQYTYVPAPLEESYVRTWEKWPREMREFVLNPPA